MQSELGQHLLRETPKGENEPKSDYASLVLIENGVSIRRSTAALRIARHLSGAWPVLSLLYIVSMSLRDRVYDIVAHNRLRFGDHHKRTCPLPSQDMRNRMLESAKAFDLD
jgi:predicted DCC family thiol-disulfide oxidoreductase YuxK